MMNMTRMEKPSYRKKDSQVILALHAALDDNKTIRAKYLGPK